MTNYRIRLLLKDGSDRKFHVERESALEATKRAVEIAENFHPNVIGIMVEDTDRVCSLVKTTLKSRRFGSSLKPEDLGLEDLPDLHPNHPLKFL